MNRRLLSGIFLCLFALTAMAQNRAKFHHIIRLSQVRNGYLRLIYNNGTDHILFGSTPDPNYNLCSDLECIVTLGTGGSANVDFFSTRANSTSPCIGNATPLGSFRLDIGRSTLGSPTYVYKIPFKARSWSIASVPFRYRFKTDSSLSTITTNLSASVSYGWTWGQSWLTHRSMTNYSITMGPFVGITSIDLKKATVKSPSAWVTDRTNAGLSYGASITLARNNFGIVISVGADHAIGKYSSFWSYQNKVWVGLGINANLGLF